MIKTKYSGLRVALSREKLRLFCRALNQPAQVVNAKIPIDISISPHVPELDLFDREIRNQRNERGDSVLIAFHQSQPVAYLFATTHDCWVGEIENWLTVEPNEVYLYDAYTQPPYRGNRIYSTLLSSATDFFSKKACSCALIFTRNQNESSIRGIERCGFHPYGTAYYANLFGTQLWDFRTENTYVKSRFKNEN